MAISDTLSDAVVQIQEVLADRPDAYVFMRERLERLVSDMDAVRIELDRVPINLRGPTVAGTIDRAVNAKMPWPYE